MSSLIPKKVSIEVIPLPQLKITPIDPPPKPKPKREGKPTIKPIPIEFRSIINRLTNHYWTTWFKSTIPIKKGKMLEDYLEINELRKKVKLEAIK